eukprot:CAMPEP_0115147166 /NCGR_PEP_ID=MMETSP0227-20121206/63141_1 /TAXON_ID=89957 /ORGANISM="Polarella glacialis, Strain CCMP 1383" /LENGTH=104 /DNA_ID=CAMNT_0002557007 /DNA_START=30 /DNA_END=341 /DNA_ORIENTATION=-
MAKCPGRALQWGGGDFGYVGTPGTAPAPLMVVRDPMGASVAAGAIERNPEASDSQRSSRTLPWRSREASGYSGRLIGPDPSAAGAHGYPGGVAPQRQLQGMYVA